MTCARCGGVGLYGSITDALRLMCDFCDGAGEVESNTTKESDMAKENNPVQFFQNLGRALADDEGMTREQVRAELREEGIDPDAVVARVRALVKQYEELVDRDDQ